MLSRKTTIHELLAEYPFLAGFLSARDPVFARLRDPSSAGRWARVVTLGEAAVEMDVPWLDLLREIQAEVLHVTGAAPAVADAAPVTPADARVADGIRALVRELEQGAPLDGVAARLGELTRGLDDGGVAALAARESPPQGRRSALDAAAAGAPGTPGALHAGHPIAALHRECARLARLADLVDEIVGSLGDPPDPSRLEEARGPLLGLVDRLHELSRQGRRLRLAWHATVRSRLGPTLAILTAERIEEALEALVRLRAAVSGDEPAAVAAQARTSIALVRRALATADELLAPAAQRALDDDDWEVVAEQERVVGWALAPDQAL